MSEELENGSTPQSNNNYEYNTSTQYTATTSLEADSAPMRISEWVVTLILTAIPIVNIVLLFVWAFGTTENIHRKNFAKASLILIGIGVALTFVFMIFGILLGIAASFSYY